MCRHREMSLFCQLRRAARRGIWISHQLGDPIRGREDFCQIVSKRVYPSLAKLGYGNTASDQRSYDGSNAEHGKKGCPSRVHLSPSR